MRSSAVCSSSFSVCAALSIALSACIAVPAAHAAAAPSAAPSSAGAPSSTVFRIDSALVAPLQDAQYRTEGVSSSSLDDERLNLSSEGLTGDGAGQPPTGRRRSYGRSRYQDRLHNPDGSSRIAFVAGAGAAVPVGNTGKFYTLSYAVEAGAGINFNKTFGVLGEFHYDHLGLTGGAINYQYNQYLGIGATPSDLAGFDANAHVISLTVNPIVNVTRGDHSKLGAYVTGGVGYYRKSTNFTLPSLSQDYFGNVYSQNVNISTDTANAFGVNGGLGLTYKLSEFSSERLFAEARYNWLNISSTNAANDNFPFNRRNTEFIPVQVGIRF